MSRCEDEKMFYRPPLLEEPCAQTLSGKKRVLMFYVNLEFGISSFPYFSHSIRSSSPHVQCTLWLFSIAMVQMAHRNRGFTELKNGWIFPWRTVNVITRWFPLLSIATILLRPQVELPRLGLSFTADSADAGGLRCDQHGGLKVGTKSDGELGMEMGQAILWGLIQWFIRLWLSHFRNLINLENDIN